MHSVLVTIAVEYITFGSLWVSTQQRGLYKGDECKVIVYGSWLNAEQDNRLGASPQQPTWQRDLLKVKTFWHMHGLHETSGENV
jgi:hypothetical protein